MFNTKNKKKGFTLRKSKGFTIVELLVVILIIAVLSAIVMVNLNASRQKSRDVRRQADLKQMATALSSYYDFNLSYPSTWTGSSCTAAIALTTTSACWTGTSSTFGNKSTSGPTGYIPALAPQYISALPVDPKTAATTANAGYIYTSNGTDYKIMAYNTVEGTITATDPFRDTRPATYQVSSAGANTW